MQYFHYDGVKQLNRLNVNGVSMNPSPISEIIISHKKRVEKLSKYAFYFILSPIKKIKARGFTNVQTSLLIFWNINTCRYDCIAHK